MEFIVDTGTHREALGQKRLLFSWMSFYGGVAVAMGVMLIAHAQPSAPNVGGRAEHLVQLPAATSTGSVSASVLVLAIERASPNASDRGASVALEHLRWRGAAPVSALDREYAALAVMELMSKTRVEAEAVVDGWLQRPQ